MTSGLAELILAEADRARLLDEDPAAFRFWTRAPWALRYQYRDGVIDAETFWLRFALWLRFELRQAA